MDEVHKEEFIDKFPDILDVIQAKVEDIIEAGNVSNSELIELVKHVSETKEYVKEILEHE